MSSPRDGPFKVQTVTISNRCPREMRLSEEDLRKFYGRAGSFALPDVAVRTSRFRFPYLAHVSVPEDDLLEYYDSHAATYTRQLPPTRRNRSLCRCVTRSC